MLGMDVVLYNLELAEFAKIAWILVNKPSDEL